MNNIQTIAASADTLLGVTSDFQSKKVLRKAARKAQRQVPTTDLRVKLEQDKQRQRERECYRTKPRGHIWIDVSHEREFRYSYMFASRCELCGAIKTGHKLSDY